MPGICFLYTWKQHSHCLNLNLSLNHGLGRHIHVLYVFPCCKKYPPTYWVLVTGSVISPYIFITGDGICRRYGLVVSCEVVAATTFLLLTVFKIHACHRDEGFVILAGFFAGFTRQPPVCPVAGVTSGGRHYRTAIKLYSLTLCVLYPKRYSYQHPSYLGVLDMCLILSLYLHVLSLSVGFRYHYLWYCLYVYLLIICMYYFICGFYVSLSFDIVYMYIYLWIYLLKVGD